jgi:hypothetical protein
MSEEPEAADLDFLHGLVLDRPRTFAALWDAVAHHTKTVDAVALARLGDVVRKAIAVLIREKRIRAWGGGGTTVYTSITLHRKACHASSVVTAAAKKKSKGEKRAERAEKVRAKRRRDDAKVNADAVKEQPPATRGVIRR